MTGKIGGTDSVMFAEINSSLIALRQPVPVVGVIAGAVGCFGGMSITASLCSYLIMTRKARLGLNGPEVIEEQSGIEEFDSKDRQLIWGVNGAASNPEALKQIGAQPSSYGGGSRRSGILTKQACEA